MPRLKLACAALALSFLGGYCGNDNTGQTGDAGAVCKAYVVPAGTDLTTPTTFEGNVLPLFKRSCVFSSCHDQSSQRIVLGSSMKMAGIEDPINAAVVANLVNKPSTDLPAMPFVTPGDPSKSFLMHKIDGDNCTLNAQCVGGDCLGSMPDRSDLLTVADRDIVRRWILQGAKGPPAPDGGTAGDGGATDGGDAGADGATDGPTD